VNAVELDGKKSSRSLVHCATMLGQSEVMSLHKKENYDVPSFLGLRVPFRDVVDTVSLNN